MTLVALLCSVASVAAEVTTLKLWRWLNGYKNTFFVYRNTDPRLCYPLLNKEEKKPQSWLKNGLGAGESLFNLPKNIIVYVRL